MIYLIVFAFLLAAFAFFRRSRRAGVLTTLLDVLASASLGWIAGVLIGVGARIGMWSIPFFNGTEPRITFDGTFRVILTFSLFGIGLGVLYELLFRELMRGHGLFFGLLITAIAAYPLGAAGVQQLSFDPPNTPMIVSVTAIVGIMFVPFAVVLECLLERWHRFRETKHMLGVPAH
jgi:hypothetical protein